MSNDRDNDPSLHGLLRTPAPITGFIFDLDGVLIDSNPLHIDAWRRALAAHGHHVAPEKIFPEIGKGGDKLVVSLLGQSVEDQQGNALRAAQAQEYAALVSARGLVAFEGGPELIADLRARGVATALARQQPERPAWSWPSARAGSPGARFSTRS